MRLLYFVQYFYPEKASGQYLVNDLLEAFVAEGWNVDVFTPMPTRGIDKSIRKSYKKNRIEVKCDGKLIIHRIPLFREGRGFVERSIRYMIFSLQCMIIAFKEPAQIIFTGSGPPTQGTIMGYVRKYKKGVSFIYNLQDIFPDSLINAGLSKENSIFVRIGRKMESYAYNNADLIITISNDMYNNVINKGVNCSKLCVIRNWIDTEVIQPVSRRDNDLFDKFNLDREKFYVLYSGNLGYTMGLECIIEAAHELKQYKDIKFLFFGDGSERNKLMALVFQYGLDNVEFHPFEPEENISKVYGLANLAVISSRAGLGTVSMPSKTGTIMAAGVPILGIFDSNSEFWRIIESAKCGLCAEPGNVHDIVSKIMEVYSSREIEKDYAKQARKYALKYISKEKALQAYVNAIKDKVKDNCFD